MDAMWLAPVLALLVGGLALVLVGVRTRRAVGELADAPPRVALLLAEVRSLRADLEQVRDRLQDRPPRAGTGTERR